MDFTAHPEPFPDEQTWRAVGKRAVDGDTYDVWPDLGFEGTTRVIRVRLEALDTPEKYGAHAEPRGVGAQQRAAELVEGKPLMITTRKAGAGYRTTLARYVARVYVWGPAIGRETAWVSLAGILEEEGHRK